jgi:hypothetical protein
MFRCGHAASYLSVPGAFVPSRPPACLDQEPPARRRMVAWVRDLNSRRCVSSPLGGYIRTLPSSPSVQSGLCAISHT